ncbi:hypothetical protein [Spirochaeta isovalerica]|uniref:Outer membrane protein beta-barrel domain-containing protein n=1 Tax=Spirochaeta isovalerica TaxID=150 RepID=A0A841REX9_9SPIO|nr:hypothetical protein [Spirochaeta isovalerica]MBB6482635.1 hypothetical protein [Spirochaeta isovalerica]
MKKVLLLLVSLAFLTAALSAETKTVRIDNNRSNDAFKAGVVLGYPTGLTAGWRLGEVMELNFVAATHYYDITIGVAPMFTLVSFDIQGQKFPLSIGPAAYLNIGWYGGLALDVLFNARVEYSFEEIPLNLFLEAGAGIAINFGGGIGPQGSGALGVRYIF